jgi:hypothetical protein
MRITHCPPYPCLLRVLGFESRWELGIFLFPTASSTALVPIQPPIQCVPGSLYLGVKRPGREVDRSPLSSAEVKNAWIYTSTPQYSFTASCPVKAQGQFYFTLLYFTFHIWRLSLPFAVLHFLLDYGLDDRGFESRQGLGTFPFTTTSRPALGLTQLPMQWVPGALSLGIKRPGRETDHWHSTIAEVKNTWNYNSTRLVRHLHGVVLS